MSISPQHLARLCHEHGRIARVVVAETRGSTPREVGADMMVWPGGQQGSIGGGELELQATNNALTLLSTNQSVKISRNSLGPDLGQCCGGAVTLLTEIFDVEKAEAIPESGMFARVVNGTAEKSLAVTRAFRDARNLSNPIEIKLVDGWAIESIARTERHLWIYGAGHVGRALVDIMAPVSGVQITWIDTHSDRYPDEMPQNVDKLWAEKPDMLVRHAPPNAEHLVLTYSHALDLEICHQILSHSFTSAGLIGSKTKWARFQKRLAALGHSQTQINRIICPIGDPTLGKVPQAIAIGVASRLLSNKVSSNLKDIVV
jgi:xanthine dehydrogenase accessory factor